LSLLLSNVDKVPLADIAWPLAVVEGGALAALLASRAVCPSWRRAGLYSLAAVVLLLFFQRFDPALGEVLGDALNVWLRATLWLALTALAWQLIRRARGCLHGATIALNIATLAFIAAPLALVGYFNYQFLQVREAAVAAIN
jgi:hypothetical protein